MGLTRFVIRRLALSALTVLVVATIVFLVVNIVPGDPARYLMGTNFNAETYFALRHKLGLDRPLYVRYGEWLWRLVNLDLGTSIMSGQPVAQIVASRVPTSLLLCTTSIAIATVIGVPLGIVSAVSSLRRKWLTNWASSSFAYVGVSMPQFWLALMLILLFAFILNIMPAGGWPDDIAADPLRTLYLLALPAFTLGLIAAANIARMVRTNMMEVMLADYIVTARAKGLIERIVVYKHALKNALIPVVTVIGLHYGYLFGGAIVVEVLFRIPGLGRLLYISIITRDLMLIQGLAVALTFLLVFINLVVDIVYAAIDPKIRYG